MIPRRFSLLVLFALLSVHLFLVSADQQLEIRLVTKSVSLAKKSEGVVKVRVTNAAGAFATNAKVFLLKAYPTNQEDNVLVANQELFPVEGDPSSFQFNFLALKPEAGLYTLELRASPVEKKSGFLAVDRVETSVKVVGSAVISDAQLTVSDSSDTLSVSEGRKYRPDFDKKLDEVVKAEHFQHFLFEYRVKGQAGKNIQVQQAFLRISNKESGRELIKLSQFSTKGYSVSVSLQEVASEFYGQSGNYDLQLIVGDAFVTTPISWVFATAHINFPNASRQELPASPFEVKPEIVHRFRVPDSRPPKTISLAFTAAVLGIPFLVLIIGLVSVGANLGNFPSGSNFIFAVGFQGSLAAILALFAVYWYELNMVQTLGYLTVLSLPFLFFSHRNLNALSTVKEHTD